MPSMVQDLSRVGFVCGLLRSYRLPSPPLTTGTEPPSQTRPNLLEHSSMIAVVGYKVRFSSALRESRGGRLIGLCR